MRNRPLRFAEIVRSDPAVRGALSCYLPARLCWKLVLGLHGRAVARLPSLDAARQVVSGGFRIYAVMYRLVAVALLALAAVAVLWAGLQGLMPWPLGAGLGLALVVIGGGSYGLELAYLFAACESRYGAEEWE